MIAAYFDASALVKLLLDEPGSDEAAALWDTADLSIASSIIETEVRAALAAARRAGRLDEASHPAAKRRWESHWPELEIVEFTPDLARAASDLSEEHALGALDAIHLASAALFVDAGLILATWDRRLLTAARSRGMPTLPASLP